MPERLGRAGGENAPLREWWNVGRATIDDLTDAFGEKSIEYSFRALTLGSNDLRNMRDQPVTKSANQ